MPDELARLVAYLADRGTAALAGVSDSRLLEVWVEVVEEFRDPGSEVRRRLDAELARRCRLSPEGLAAGLETVLGGVSRGPAAGVVERARARPAPSRTPVLVVLASNLPGLAVQPLLPALALRRPVVLKSPSAEPLFAAAFVAALAAREAALGEGLAALAWRGGDPRPEAPLLAAAGAVVAYGEAATLADLGRRAKGGLIGYGPRASLAVLGADADPVAAAAGLARDVALFDQRGCLSVAAVYTAGDPEALAAALARELAAAAVRWPPGPATAAEAAGVAQLREEAALRGLPVAAMPHAAGLVVIDPEPAFRPTPGRRTVRIHPLADLDRLPALLAPWRDRLQGAALAGEAARALAPRLESLGLSRFTAPGDLQSPDAAWHNGGIDPLEALAR